MPKMQTDGIHQSEGPQRDRAGCVPVIRDDEGKVASVLLVTSGQFQGKFILPAGKVEPADSRVEDAALR
jgi:8-oxo-dGTP pyrophosphatase MutT (NUDIX family)